MRRRTGSACQAAYLADPDVIEAMASRDDEDGPQVVPMEGFGSIDSRLANMEDRLAQLIYAGARLDPSAAPTVPRPVYPHVQVREEKRRARMRAFELQLIPGGE